MFKSKWMNFLICVVILLVMWTSYNIKYDVLNNQLEAANVNLQKEENKVTELNAEIANIQSKLDAANTTITDLKNSEYKLVYMGEFKITHYCVENFEHICGNGDGFTATGTTITPGRTIAVDPSVIPYGSKVYIEGYGWRSAEDCGGAVKNNHIDMAVYTHDEAMSTGIKHKDVWVLVKKY